MNPNGFCPIYAEEYSALRTNPDRGFRMEVYMMLGSHHAVFGGEDKDALDYLKEQREFYRDDTFHLAQVYVYLTEYCKKDLDEKAFSQLEEYLTELKKMGMRAVLRFAYEREMDRKEGPKNSILIKHTKQIKKWLSEHKELVSETVAVIQAGMVGAWGEWHSSKHRHNPKKTLEAIFDMVPDYLTLQIRTETLMRKNKALFADKRVGHHDDFLVGEFFKWSYMESKPGSDKYKEIIERAAHTYNDGEMPWGRDSTYNKGYIHGEKMLFMCNEQSLSSLSLTHNYKEAGGPYNMERWRGEYITPAELDEMGCTYNPNYFRDKEGNEFVRTTFDFLADHLGYQISAEDFTLSETETSITLKNYGFALPYHLDNLVLVTDKGEIAAQDYSPEKLLSGMENTFTFGKLSENSKVLGIKLYESRCPSLCAALANDFDFKDGINYFKN